MADKDLETVMMKFYDQKKQGPRYEGEVEIFATGSPQTKIYKINDGKRKLVIKTLSDDCEDKYAKEFAKEIDDLHGKWSGMKYSIGMDAVGQISLKGATRKAALVMDDGGMNLKDLVAEKEYQDQDQSVKEAYAHKVVLTALRGIEEIYNKTRSHADIIHRNILSGVFAGEQITDEVLIYSRVLLCDPNLSKNKSPMRSVMHSLGPDKEVTMGFFDKVDLTVPGKEEYDLFSAFSVYQYLNQEKDDVAFFVADNLKINMRFDKDFGVRRYAPLGNTSDQMGAGQLFKLVKNAIEKDNYFKVDEHIKDGHTFPVVLRPIDRLKKLSPIWRKSDGSKLEADLTRFSSSNSSSLEKLLPVLRSASEKEVVLNFYNAELLRGAQEIGSRVGALIDDRSEFEVDYQKNSDEIKKITGQKKQAIKTRGETVVKIQAISTAMASDTMEDMVAYDAKEADKADKKVILRQTDNNIKNYTTELATLGSKKTVLEGELAKRDIGHFSHVLSALNNLCEPDAKRLYQETKDSISGLVRPLLKKTGNV
jgi:hypothetical protein